MYLLSSFVLFPTLPTDAKKFWQVNPSDVIILEGMLIFHDIRVRDLMNMKIFVDTVIQVPSPFSYTNALYFVFCKFLMALCHVGNNYTYVWSYIQNWKHQTYKLYIRYIIFSYMYCTVFF